MAGRFHSLRVRIHSRRTFLRRGSAAVTGLMLGACDQRGGDIAEPTGQRASQCPISTNEEFYAVWYRGGPGDVDLDSWRLSIQRNGVEQLSLDWGFVSSLEPEEVELTLQCIESRPGLERMNNALWKGRSLSSVLEQAGAELEGGSYIRFACADGYSLALPVEDLARPIWLLWTMNGEALPLAHGYPLRAIIPGRMGWMNPKQIIEIDVIDDPYELPWLDELMSWLEAEGLTMDMGERSMTYQVQALIVDPHEIVWVEQGERVEIRGKAFAGSDPVVRVDVSTDGGGCWECAELTYAPGADRWTLWSFEWVPECAGVHHVEIRCSTAGGMETEDDAPLSHIPWSGGMSMEIEVA